MPAPKIGRRATDGQPPPAVSLLEIARAWGPAALTVTGLLGFRLTGPSDQVTALQAEVAADRAAAAVARREDLTRDSLSILDRDATATAVSMLGRQVCRDLGADEGVNRGLPCPLLLRGERWPLLHGSRVATIATTPVPMPAPAPPTFALAALLVPAAVVRRGVP